MLDTNFNDCIQRNTYFFLHLLQICKYMCTSVYVIVHAFDASFSILRVVNKLNHLILTQFTIKLLLWKYIKYRVCDFPRILASSSIKTCFFIDSYQCDKGCETLIKHDL